MVVIIYNDRMFKNSTLIGGVPHPDSKEIGIIKFQEAFWHFIEPLNLCCLYQSVNHSLAANFGPIKKDLIRISNFSKRYSRLSNIPESLRNLKMYSVPTHSILCFNPLRLPASGHSYRLSAGIIVFWRHPNRIITRREFIRAFKRNGMIGRLGIGYG